MADRDPLHDPRAGDIIISNGVTRVIVYSTVYGKVFYTNPSGVRKTIDLNSYRKWAEGGTAEAGPPPGWTIINAKIKNQLQAETQKICEHFAANYKHPTNDLVIETLLEFGVAVATSNAHGREKVYAALRRKLGL
jgi:hypothetical protein